MESAMRLEATVPDSHGQAVVELADELGLSRSQIIDEALGLFLKAVMEVRRGRRLMAVAPGGDTGGSELATPTLTALEWVTQTARLDLSADEVTTLHALLATPPAPTEHLRNALMRTAR
jgi:hypothetical protein